MSMTIDAGDELAAAGDGEPSVPGDPGLAAERDRLARSLRSTFGVTG